MKKTVLLISLLLALLMAAGVSAETLSPALDIIAGENGMKVSGLSGETVTFTSSDFAEAAGDQSFEAITVSTLPAKTDGTLYLSDTAVSAGQKIPEKSLSSLRFEPCEGAKSASFQFTFDQSYTMSCSIIFSDRQNDAPTVSESASVKTFIKTDYAGCMRGFDKNGDELTYEIVSFPEKGSLKYESAGGEYVYTPSSKTGEDSFSYRVQDKWGAYSDVCTVNVDVVRNTTSLAFSDMDESGACAAAVKLCDEGIMTYSEENGKQYFDPTSEVSRLDFLVTAMNVFGASGIPEIEDTGFADDDSIPAEYKGYVYSAAKLGIISGIVSDGKSCFIPDKTITRAEASVILNNIIGHSASTGVTCSDEVPDWADEAVSAMYELGIFDLDSGEVKAANSLVKEDAAQMLFNLSCLLGE